MNAMRLLSGAQVGPASKSTLGAMKVTIRAGQTWTVAHAVPGCQAARTVYAKSRISAPWPDGVPYMYEHHSAPLLPRRAFQRRLAQHGGYAIGLLTVSLLVGTAGFHYLAFQPVVDSLLNAAMLLGGMGPVGEIRSTPGKLFAAGFALYAGLVFLAVGAILFAPVVHRFMHRFHLAEAQRRSSE
jgi:hypothetical protein